MFTHGSEPTEKGICIRQNGTCRRISYTFKSRLQHYNCKLLSINCKSETKYILCPWSTNQRIKYLCIYTYVQRKLDRVTCDVRQRNCFRTKVCLLHAVWLKCIFSNSNSVALYEAKREHYNGTHNTKSDQPKQKRLFWTNICMFSLCPDNEFIV